jgi:hypothetical protein
MMTFRCPELFDRAAAALLPHLGHKITIMAHGGDFAPDDISVECEDCRQALINFQPEVAVDVIAQH